MRYGSVCSGIEAASLAWEPLGWQAAWFAEIEKFPSQVLAARWPHVPNMGDMCRLPEYIRAGLLEAPDVLVGGTPCQAYSVAGRREGLNDERGQLTLKYVEVADAIDDMRPDDPCIVVWENVPGVLSDKTNAFGCFLGDLVGEDIALEPPGGKWSNAGVVHGPRRTAAWRVLDAQYFGVAQRRRRVFVVASARKGFHPASVLFESEGVRRDSAPSRTAREGVTGNAQSSFGIDGEQNVTEELMGTLRSHQSGGYEGARVAIPTLCIAHGQAGAEIRSDGEPSLTCNHEAPIICQYGDVAGSLTARHDSSPCADRGMNVIACFKSGQGAAARSIGFSEDVSPSLPSNAGGNTAPALLHRMQVRRLMPVECERLQGMPDNHTLLTPNTADGPRYKAIGNSKAVPVVRWLGRRIQRAVHP